METELQMLEECPQVNIHPDGLKATFKKIANWKTPVLDSIHGFWFKKFTSIHDRLVTKMNKHIQKTEIPECMIKVKTPLIQNSPIKGVVLTNDRLLMCLPMMWKILTVQIREKIYYSLVSPRIFLDEKKRCQKTTRGTKDLIYIDRHTLIESKTRRKYLAMVWIDNKKVYDMVFQSGILHCLKMYKILSHIEPLDKQRRTHRYI